MKTEAEIKAAIETLKQAADQLEDSGENKGRVIKLATPSYFQAKRIRHNAKVLEWVLQD